MPWERSSDESRSHHPDHCLPLATTRSIVGPWRTERGLTMDYANPQLADALASQYVAGTLRGRARRRFEALLGAHATLRAAVRRWQDRLIPLTAVLAPQTPPLRVWQSVERTLWPQLATPAE